MIIALNMMNFVLKTMNSVLKEHFGLPLLVTVRFILTLLFCECFATKVGLFCRQKKPARTTAPTILETPRSWRPLETPRSWRPLETGGNGRVAWLNLSQVHTLKYKAHHL